MDIIDIMNMVKVKGYVYGIIIIICLTGIMVFVYNTVITTIMGIIKGEDYILYDPKQIPLFLLLPAMVVADLFVICLLLPFRKKTDVIMQKLFIPTTVYAIVAFAIGIFMSMVISFYPLGTDYYQCKSTSIVSSGSYYARTKEMCKQRAYISTNEEERSPGKPGKNRLESPVQ
ncbi:hypothetical protein [Enterobacter sp. RHBSTW-00175]|uniref:hypothetical protein n=1 Tax=Enterobacter sp. RHBSTW-00175 TaxID=2742639 RepID=UPI0015E93D4A|nr:hypothetical protein [Enterobacter sp. RHBSTW-00175]QMR75145.1 hypothetical protein HV107_05715 [Enterobacter sp. RHBSTW-00175]